MKLKKDTYLVLHIKNWFDFCGVELKGGNWSNFLVFFGFVIILPSNSFRGCSQANGKSCINLENNNKKASDASVKRVAANHMVAKQNYV